MRHQGAGEGRDEELVVGRRSVLEALRQGRALHRILLAESHERHGTVRTIRALAERAGVPVTLLPREALDRYGSHHQGVVAVVAPVGYVDLDALLPSPLSSSALIALLDGITDPQNLGAIARSLEAFGGQGLVVPRHRSAGISPGALRASAGALFSLPVARVANLAHTAEVLQREGFQVAATLAEGGRAPWELELGGRLAVIVGAEDRGVSQILRRRADLLVTIPLSGRTKALNASAAAAVVFYEWMRQNRSNSG